MVVVLQVFQYMITIMVSLMMTQNAMERYWSSSGTSTTAMQKFLLALFLSYPLITLLLVILSNNEIAIRRFMYYRLMSLQVIVDWHNTPFYKVGTCVKSSCKALTCCKEPAMIGRLGILASGLSVVGVAPSLSSRATCCAWCLLTIR